MSFYAISKLDDTDQIRTFLNRDPAYSAYALADLEPPAFNHTEWYAASRTGEIEGLALVYSALDPAILFLMGETPALSALLMHGVGPDRIFLSAPSDMASVFPDFYRIIEQMGMFRMRITRGIFNQYLNPALASGDIVTLTREDSPEISALLDLTSEADGRDPRDVFFEPGLVEDGYYRGLRIDGSLIAVAGTHIVSKQSSVAAVGNVAVHPDHRRNGLGGLVSQLTTEALLDDGYEMIVLNVRQNNQAANKIYRRLGYKQITPFIEGIAERH